MRSPVLACLLLSSLACAAPQRRSGYVLTEVDDLVVSNSTMVNDRPPPRWLDGRIEVAYTLLLLNRGSAPVPLAPENLRADMEYLPVEIHCRSLTDPSSPRELPVEIAPGMELRLECLLRLSDEATRLASAGDRLIVLTLQPHNGEQVHFNHFLTAESR